MTMHHPWLQDRQETESSTQSPLFARPEVPASQRKSRIDEYRLKTTAGEAWENLVTVLGLYGGLMVFLFILGASRLTFSTTSWIFGGFYALCTIGVVLLFVGESIQDSSWATPPISEEENNLLVASTEVRYEPELRVLGSKVLPLSQERKTQKWTWIPASFAFDLEPLRDR